MEMLTKKSRQFQWRTGGSMEEFPLLSPPIVSSLLVLIPILAISIRLSGDGATFLFSFICPLLRKKKLGDRFSILASHKLNSIALFVLPPSSQQEKKIYPNNYDHRCCHCCRFLFRFFYFFLSPFSCDPTKENKNSISLPLSVTSLVTRQRNKRRKPNN